MTQIFDIFLACSTAIVSFELLKVIAHETIKSVSNDVKWRRANDAPIFGNCVLNFTTSVGPGQIVVNVHDEAKLTDVRNVLSWELNSVVAAISPCRCCDHVGHHTVDCADVHIDMASSDMMTQHREDRQAVDNCW